MDTVSDRVETATFDVQDGGALSVSNVAGRITVYGSDEPGIEMRAVKEGSPDAIERTRIEWTRTDDDVRIETKADTTNSVFGLVTGKKMSAVLYEIRVPRGCRVTAGGVSADIELRGLRAPVSARTVSGDLVIEDVEGDVSAQSVSGDLTAHAVGGALTLRTTSGDARITESAVERLNIHTVSGDCLLETPLVAGAVYRMQTVSGDLHLHVPPGTGASAHLKTVSGQVSVTGLKSSVAKSGPRTWQGLVNGGGATVEMQSVSGDLRLEATGGEEEPARDDAETSAASREDTLHVLKLLEAGEITLDEAMTRLSAASE